MKPQLFADEYKAMLFWIE